MFKEGVKLRRRLLLKKMIAESDRDAPHSDEMRAWDEMQPVGAEWGADEDIDLGVRMKRELSQKILSAAPRLYRGRDKPLTESLMGFGFACHDGWFQILYDLSLAIEAQAEMEGRTEENWPEVVQVKEKFATLSYYIFNSSEAIQALIGDAQRLSAVTCETCGEPGKIYECNHIYYTSCPTHMREDSKPSGMHFV